MHHLDEETLRKNEVDANKSLAKGSVILAIILAIVWVLYLTKAFQVNDRTLLQVNISFPIFIVLLGLTLVYSHLSWINNKSFKIFLIVQFAIVISILNILLPKHTMIGWAACIILVAHYYNPKLALFTFISVLVLMFVSLYLGMLFGEWDANLLNAVNYITVDGVTVSTGEATWEQRFRWLQILRENGDNRFLKAFAFYYLPRAGAISLVGLICHALTQRSAKLLKDEAEQVSINSRISGELEMARNIQSSVLPKTLDDGKGDDVAALMDPAKEVGGDFYDYFAVDENHLALVIADVSGKGVPGALFMMKAATLIKSLTQSLGENTANIMMRSNIALCSNNQADMFVTCWLGILDLNSGELKFTNAGHNNPLIIQNGEVRFLESKHGLVLGALETATYTETTIKLNKNDKLILYTDGVTEAHNREKQLFGELRLLEFTKSHIGNNPNTFISDLRKEITDFANGSEQFDDITMLMFEYEKGASMMESRTFKADVSELDNLFAYSSTLLNLLNFTRKEIIMINTALEEVFVNVAKYAFDGEGYVEVSLSNDKNNVIFIFKDKGKKFNPLERKDPNINASSDEREIGGLGIFMVKNIMDEVKYSYEDGYNILTLIKKRH